jgi:two-component system NtrC family sensor kinase
LNLGTGEDNGFDLLEKRLQLIQNQQDLLELNSGIAIELVSDVNSLVDTARANADEATRASTQAIFTGRTLLLAISAVGVTGAVLISWLFVGRVLVRRIQQLSNWMLRMAGGDLEAQVDLGGRDEVADMADALEVFRRHALEVQRLNLVEQLAEELQGKNDQLESVLADLQKAQEQIVMREKLAALGELTAGVAHEIKNPLNFVKNFSESSGELLDELREVLEENADKISEDDRGLIQEISDDLNGNLARILSHGDRANRIVQDMLMMGRETGEERPTDINSLLDEHARLAYHSARATDPNFQLNIEQELGPDVGQIVVKPQDIGRVFLNIVGNACDATDEKRRALHEAGDTSYMPTLSLFTSRGEENIEIRIRDNGDGIPPDVADRIFNPFFTTKPTDRGTGLGLAISSDIVRQHGGSIEVNSQPGEFTEMTVKLPLEPTQAVATAPDGESVVS